MVYKQVDRVYKKIMFVCLVIGLPLLVSLFFNYQSQQEKESLEYEYKQLELNFKRTQRERMVLADSISSISLRYKVVSDSLVMQREEIKKIKGRYNKHSSSELEIEMERRVTR